MKLDIGCGTKCLEGYTPIDNKVGREAFPLSLPSDSVEAIHCSHLLEHFSHRQSLDVLNEWVRVLQPGGTCQIAVPNFNKIIEVYQSSEAGKYPIEMYCMGGQVDDYDIHMSLWTEDKLRDLMKKAGLTDIKPWTSGQQDCASLPISLNLQGVKLPVTHKQVNSEGREAKSPAVVKPSPPVAHQRASEALPVVAPASTSKPVETTNVTETKDSSPTSSSEQGETGIHDIFCEPEIILGKTKVTGVWTTPRLGFLDTVDCMYQVLPHFGIPAIRGTGVFWGQAISAAMEKAIDEGAEWLMTLDYDSIFEKQDIQDMINLINKYPGSIDALCPHQFNRQRSAPLWHPVRNPDGSEPDVTDEDINCDIYPISTGHFGMTLIRVASILRMKKPWFIPIPDKDGTWHDGKIDDDIGFWNQFRDAGGKVFLAPNVTLGHLELDIRWAGKGCKLLHQHFLEYRAEGKPKDVFKVTK